MPICKIILSILFLILSAPAFAGDWDDHFEDITDLERNIVKLQQEMDVLVEKKKKTREQARIEQTLQRIVEIHAELISYRKNMDNMRDHLKLDHPDKVHILDNYDSRMFAVKKKKGKYRGSPLSQKLDHLLIKVQIKYSSFIRTDEKSDEMIAVENVEKRKRKQKKEREADVYLRRRSKIRLVK